MKFSTKQNKDICFIFCFLLIFCEGFSYTEIDPLTSTEPNIVWNNTLFIPLEGKWSGMANPSVNFGENASQDPNKQFSNDLIFTSQSKEDASLYRQDAIRWITCIINEKYIPKELDTHLVALHKKTIPVLGGLQINNPIVGTDGFVASYQVGHYLLKLTDTACELRIVVNDIGRRGKKYEHDTRIEFVKSVMKNIFHRECAFYKDGTFKNIRSFDKNDYSSGFWNWQISSAKDDSETVVSDLSQHYLAHAWWHADGKTIIFAFSKVYPKSKDLDASLTSRFTKNYLYTEPVSKAHSSDN